MKATKKPVEIDYFVYTKYEEFFEGVDLVSDWVTSLGDEFWKHFSEDVTTNELRVKTLEGHSYPVKDGDIIIRGVKGEYYPCQHDIFYQTYNIH